MDYEIRQAAVSDAPAISRIYGHYVAHTAASFEEQVPDAATTSRRIAETLDKYPYFVADMDGTTMGYAYAGPHRIRTSYRWSVDVTIYLDQAYHRRGIGRALYGVLLPLLPELGYVTAYAGIALPNPGSVGIHESLGFSLVGIYRSVGFKLGEWRDVGWWQKQLRPPPKTPIEPLPWPAMVPFKTIRCTAAG